MIGLRFFFPFLLSAAVARASDLDISIHQFDCEDSEPALRAGPGDLGLVRKSWLKFLASEKVASNPPKKLFAMTLVADKRLIIYFTAESVEEAQQMLERLGRAQHLIYEGPCVPKLQVDGEEFAPASDPDIHHPDHWTAPL